MRSSSFPCPALVALACSALGAQPAAAQHELHVFVGEAAGDALGYALGDAGDPDGDGRGDLLIGVPRNDLGGINAGSVLVYDGASGLLLQRIDGTASEQFGWAVAGAGDVDGDGRDDWIAGAPFAGSATTGIQRGEARVHSGRTGALLHVFPGAVQFDRFGSAVDGAGDVDADGRADLLVGAPLADGNGVDSGLVYVYSGRTGALIHLRSGAQAGDQLGTSVAGLGDLDLDGRAEFAAGAPYSDLGGTNAGMLRVYAGSNAALRLSLVGAAAEAELGRAVARIGDVDQDGRSDFAAGAWRDPSGGAGSGSVTIVSGASFAVLEVLHGSPASAFGAALAGAGDIDGDGRPDLAVGAPEEGGGVARIYSGASWQVLELVPSESAGDHLGSALAGGIDANGDGRAEFAVGAWLADGPPTDAGRAVLYSHVDPLGTAYCFGDGSGSPCPCFNDGAPGEGCANSSDSGARLAPQGTPSVAVDDLVFDAEQLLPNQPALLFAGVNAVNNGNGTAFGDGLRCAGGALVRLGVRVPDASGRASFGPGLARDGGFTPGELRRFQAWYRDPQHSPCGLGFNLSHGYELTWIP